MERRKLYRLAGLVGGLLLVILLCLLPGWRRAARIRGLLKSGVDNYQKHRYDRAEAALRAALKEDPELEQAHLYLARTCAVYAEPERAELAANEYLVYLHVQPKAANVWLEYARLVGARPGLAREVAVEAYGSVLKCAGADRALQLAAYRGRAQAYYELHRWPEAATDLDAALRLAPQDSELYLLKARCLKQDNYLDPRTLGTNDPEAIARTFDQHRLQALDQAAAVLRQGLAAQPDPRLQYELGVTFMAADDPARAAELRAEAGEAFREALAGFAEQPDAMEAQLYAGYSALQLFRLEPSLELQEQVRRAFARARELALQAQNPSIQKQAEEGLRTLAQLLREPPRKPAPTGAPRP